MHNIDISTVINVHREGLIATPTLRSVERAVRMASENGISSELICVLDRPDELTRKILSEWSSRRIDVRLAYVDFGDLGLSRNHAVGLARGKWIAFIDGDDLWAGNWLSAAHRAAESEPRLAVWHPQSNLYFGQRPHIFLHVDMDDPGFDVCMLAETNLWTALCFAPRSLLLQIPYRQADHARQIGYEDWGWNIDTIAKGALHRTVPDTAHAVRTKATSLNLQTTAAACLPHRTDLFRRLLENRSLSA
jgi:hypothetical protein